MRKELLRWPGWVLSINAALLVWAAGCATPEEQSFNQNFNQDYPTAPKYVIEDRGETHFKIRMHQGSPVNGPSRVTYMKDAMTIVAEDECHRRGWANWKLDYIQERDDGWMHILVAEVRKKPAADVTPEPPAPPPGPPPQ